MRGKGDRKEVQWESPHSDTCRIHILLVERYTGMECLYLGEKIEKTGLDIFSLNTHVGMGEGRLGGWAQRYEERFEF